MAIDSLCKSRCVSTIEQRSTFSTWRFHVQCVSHGSIHAVVLLLVIVGFLVHSSDTLAYSLLVLRPHVGLPPSPLPPSSRYHERSTPVESVAQRSGTLVRRVELLRSTAFALPFTYITVYQSSPCWIRCHALAQGLARNVRKRNLGR